jgi:hypothetical protein
MRLRLALIGLLVAAAPAAAQPDPAQILTGAVEQLGRNNGSVRDYTLLLTSAGDSTWVYVHQEEDAWEVDTRDGPVLSEMLGGAVIWPRLSNPDEMAIDPDELGNARYVGTETVDGRRAHVISARWGEETGQEPDTSLIYIDTETRQILRMYLSGTMEEGPGVIPMEGPQRMVAVIEMGDYRETDGLVIPRRVRFGIRLDLADVSDEEQQEMQAELNELRQEMQGEDAAQFREFLEMMELFGRLLVEGKLDFDVRIAQVQVNSGPPAWLEENEDEDWEDEMDAADEAADDSEDDEDDDDPPAR